MAPFSLHGLNVVQPVQHDAQDLVTPFPDFSAHFDLWTNLAFESDEPLASSDKPKRKLTDDDGTPSPLGLPSQDSHENAVLPPTAPSFSPPSTPPFDLNAVLTSVGIDPLLIPAAPPTPTQRDTSPQAHPVPSLVQLLALHAAHANSYSLPSPPTAATAATSTVVSSSIPPPSKRSRPQRTSPSTDNNHDSRLPTSAQSPEDSAQSESNGTVLSAADDKRRRNTAASARFRLKKKEREAALERRAKELEDRVVELERECEGLRRENGWLKGLVVGVTGAGAAQHQQTSTK